MATKGFDDSPERTLGGEEMNHSSKRRRLEEEQRSRPAEEGIFSRRCSANT